MTSARRAGAKPLILLEEAIPGRPGGIPCPPICWEIWDDQQWAVVGPNGSGKSSLVRALSGRLPLAGGRITYCFSQDGPPGNGCSVETSPRDAIAYVDFQAQRAAVDRQDAFHQARWNSPGGGGAPRVAEYLSEQAVEGRNPFQVSGAPPDPANYAARRNHFADLLGLGPLLARSLVSLSSGERRKVVLARALLRDPRLLILDNPFVGLDRGFRVRLREVLGRLMHDGVRVMIVTTGEDDLPPGISHILRLEKGAVVARGRREAVWGPPGVREAATGAARQEATATPLARQHPAAGGTGGAVLVDMERVSVAYDGVQVLRQVDWRIREGERWALLGPNGAGKTTLLSLILGDNPQAYSNEIALFGRRRGSGESIWEIKRRMGWVAPELHLYYPDGVTCLQVACSGFFDSVGLYRPPTEEQRRTALHWMGRLGMAGLAGVAFGAASEGQQRLVLVARALVKDPALLVLDEPCQGLDAAHRRRVLDTVDAIGRRRATSLVYVTHDPRALPASISHVMRLEAGRVVTSGPRDAAACKSRGRGLSSQGWGSRRLHGDDFLKSEEDDLWTNPGLAATIGSQFSIPRCATVSSRRERRSTSTKS
jgi:molybdate transport system ATP-binding protein